MMHGNDRDVPFALIIRVLDNTAPPLMVATIGGRTEPLVLSKCPSPRNAFSGGTIHAVVQEPIIVTTPTELMTFEALFQAAFA